MAEWDVISIKTGELAGRMSYVALGDGRPLVVFPGLSRISAGASVEDQKKGAGRLKALVAECHRCAVSWGVCCWGPWVDTHG